MACCPPKKTEKHMKRSREGRSSFGPALRLNLGNRVANPRVHRSSSWLEEWRCKSQEKNQQWYRWRWWWRRLHFKSQEKERQWIEIVFMTRKNKLEDHHGCIMEVEDRSIIELLKAPMAGKSVLSRTTWTEYENFGEMVIIIEERSWSSGPMLALCMMNV